MPLPSNPQGLEGRLNALAISLLNQLDAKQPSFVASHGHYFQGIRTADTLPKDGEEVIPNIHKAPHYQPETWADFGITFPASIECSVSVFNYNGPKGKDWQLRLGVEVEGVPWVRFFSGNGTEAEDTDGWISLLPATSPFDGPFEFH